MNNPEYEIFYEVIFVSQPIKVESVNCPAYLKEDYENENVGREIFDG